MKNFKFFTEPLTYLEASLYLRFFPQDIIGVFSTHLGGTLTADGFRALTTDPKFSGVMAWFCLDTTTNPLLPRIYLAFQAMNDFIYPEDPALVQPLPGNYLAPMAKDCFGEDLRSITDYNAFLRQDHRSEPTGDDTSLTQSAVTNFSNNYIINQTIEPYQTYAHGYFANSPKMQNENYIKAFLDQGNGAVKYVRYYFGFHSHATPNFIRILLAPVDKNGYNLVGLGLIEIQLLQKSVPPPPYT